jgi:hypothetical protein
LSNSNILMSTEPLIWAKFGYLTIASNPGGGWWEITHRHLWRCRPMKQLITFADSLTGWAMLFSLPFLLATPLLMYLGLIERLFSGAPPVGFIVPTTLIFFPALLLSDMVRYLVGSLAALILTLASLIWLIGRKRGRVWRNKCFYLLIVSLVAILAFPFLIAAGSIGGCHQAVPGVG